MRKTFILLTFLCVSVMGWADTQYCETPIAEGKILYTCAKTDATHYTVILAGTSSATITGCNNCNWGINDINGVAGGSALSFEYSSAGYGSLTATFTCESTPNKPYVAYSAIATSVGLIVIDECPKDMDWTVTCGGGGGSTPESATIDWTSISWVANSGNKYKVSTISGMNVVEVQKPNFAAERGIYMTFPSDIGLSCSLDGKYATQGAGMVIYLSAFMKQETEVTVTSNGVNYTFTVYYEDGEPEDLTGWNIAKGKTSVSGYDANNTDKTHIAANDGDKNSRWSSEGGIHSPNVGAQDWWYVDLGGFYRVDQIKILFETAAPTDYDLLISNNAVSWTVLGTYTEAPKTGNSTEQYNEYNFVDKVGRYVKIFARNGYADLANGISMYEFEVYGDRASISDVNPPVMGTASLNGTPSYDRVNITVSGTDEEDGIVASFHVVDATHGVDQVQTAEAGVITVTGLTAEITYSFTITALDAAGNESANSVNVAATTAQDTSIPTVAAPVPSGTGKEILPIYCDAFASILEHGFDKDGFVGVTLMMEQNISGDHCLVYNVAGANEITWGHYNASDDEICAQSGYRGSGMGVDASAMEYLHIDIWSLQAGTNVININVNDAGLTSLRLSHNGNGWQSYDIALSDFGFNPENPAYRSDNVRWMKFNGIGFISGKMALDNVYFWKTATGLHAVSATANNASFGTASVVVTETGLAPEGGMVTDGTEVTFSATPNDGYIFVNWSNGNTNATFNATVDAAMNLTANFRALGTIYCNTEMTVSGHTIYVTLKKSGENEYKLIVNSTEELSNFGGTVMYKPDNTQVKDLRNQGVLSNGNHTLTGTMTSDRDIYFGTPLYVVFAGVGEITYSVDQGVANTPEFAVPCADAATTGVALSQTSANLLLGSTLTLTPSFTPAYATDRALTWETSNPSIATVDGGVVTPVATGSVTITAKLTSNNSVYATCNVTVVDALTPATWYGYSTIQPQEGFTAYTYSITRNANQTLTFTMTTDKNIVGYVSGITGDVTGSFSGYTAETHSGSFTTEGTYTDNDPLNLQLTFASANYGATPLAISYRVGSSNDALGQAIAIDESIDNTTILTTYDEQTVVGVVNRSFTAGNLYTLVLPFDVDAAQTASQLPGQLTKLNNSYLKENGDLRINFVDAEAVEAGVPYLYTPSADVTNPVFTGVTVSKDLHEPADGYAKYYGIYAPTTGAWLKTQTDAYVLGSDQYLYAASVLRDDQPMKALRGYFVLNFPSGANAPRARVIFNSQETEIATGISDVQSAPVQCTKVLRDGQLLIIKGNRTYNAQGQLIK